MRAPTSSPQDANIAPAEERIRNPIATFSGLDKITGHITSFDVPIDKTYRFGALEVTPRVCYTSPPYLPTKTDGFVEVNEITIDKKINRIFTGWMFADSPGLNAVEHPIYDAWLTGCKGGEVSGAQALPDSNTTASSNP
ncbi:DUF2155 domain-containing protein [Bartonella sp. DGB2]|uniref:DUF2155 domain-containing protein n=1 Tax=Bartonella sp. DGB2 TaxID=3388426 RepID=UPI00398F9882